LSCCSCCVIRLYPEYFVTIEQPMDLSTVRTKLSDDQYESVGDALADLRLIWDNCRTFNAEGSDILNSAEVCAILLEELVQVRCHARYL